MQKDKTSHILCKKSYISVNSRSQAKNSTAPGPLLYNIMDYLNGNFCFFPLLLWLYHVHGQELEELTTSVQVAVLQDLSKASQSGA